MSEKYDMAVIGGGPGGYVASLRGRQLGLSVALIEQERIGGVCLNRGCIPTKTILSDMEGLRWVQRAVLEGILEHEPGFHFSHVMRRKAAVVEQLVSGLSKHLSAEGVRTIEGKARVLDPGTVGISTGEILKARNIVIATGSRPWSPPIRGTDLDGVVTTRQILDLEKAPQTLVIIGGGIIGQEFAAIFSALGCRVTVLEALGTILSEVDSEIAKKYASLLPGRGIVTEVGVTVQAIEKTQARLRVVYEKKSKEKVAEADLVLMATGRRPYWESSGIGNLGLDVGHGAIPVDRFLRTPLEGIYAVGDVVGGKMLAHVASYHGEIVAENIAGRERTAEDNLVPSCLFTLPQIAWVGPTEQEILTSGRSFRSSTFSLSASGKALADGDSRGWIKLIEDGESRRLIGAHLMGPHVSELIGGLTLAVKKGMSATDIADTIHPHPTISEAVREAALGLLDGSIHASSRLSSLPDQRRDAIPANVR